MADEEPSMAKAAQRRAGADTLFSAEWFDDNDDFTGKKPEGLRQAASIPPTPMQSVAKEEPAPKSGMPVAAIVVGLALFLMLGGCGIGVVGAGLAYMFGVV